LYSVTIPAVRKIDDYTPRVVPAITNACIPIEAEEILWYQRGK
jgi:starch phosphorylase